MCALGCRSNVLLSWFYFDFHYKHACVVTSTIECFTPYMCVVFSCHSHLVARMKYVFEQVMLVDGTRKMRGDIIQKDFKSC